MVQPDNAQSTLNPTRIPRQQLQFITQKERICDKRRRAPFEIFHCIRLIQNKWKSAFHKHSRFISLSSALIVRRC